MRTYSAFGLDIRTDLALPGRWRAKPGSGTEVSLAEVEGTDLRRRWSGRAENGWEALIDGRRFVVELGLDGDVRMVLEEMAEFHLAPSRKRLLVAGDVGSPEVLRVLLDSVLFTVALLAGLEALHAGAVELDGGVVVVAGPQSAGKSSLVVALLECGADFFSDDIVMLRRAAAGVEALPGPPVMTVPQTMLRTAGRTICHLKDEVWVDVVGAEGPRPLAGIVLLDPRSAAARDPAVALLALAPHLVRFPRNAARVRSRFELASDLAAGVRLVVLASRSAEPAELAAEAVRELGRKDSRL